MDDQGFACALPPPELGRRRVAVLESFRRTTRRVDPLDDGHVFEFDDLPGRRDELEAFIRFEGACCGFIEMTLEPAAGGRLRLRMRAPTEALPLLRAEFVDDHEGL